LNRLSLTVQNPFIFGLQLGLRGPKLDTKT